MFQHFLRHTSATLFIVVLGLGLSACKPPLVSEEDAMMENGGDEFTGTIGDLMKNGKDVTCTFSRNDAAGDMNGTVYIARDGRMRGTFSMTNQQFGSIDMEVIRDGAYGYTWGFPSATQGTKVKLDENGKPIKDSNKESDIDDAMEYRCAKWKVDEAMLRVPNDVQFQDLSAQMEQINNAMQGVKDAKCGACDNVPEGAGRTQCRAAMGC